MTPWLSVIVPVHGGARYLGDTLSSAAAENPDGVEFLLYDSGEDGGACRTIADGFTGQLAIRYAVTPDCRPWTAKTNRGVAEARAPHVAMLHQDDLWLPGHLAAVRRALQAAPASAMSVGPSRFVDSAGSHVGPWHLPFAAGLHDGAEFTATLIVQNTIAIPSPVIRRDAFLAAGGMDDNLWYTADWDLYLKLAGQGPVYVRDQATTAFRIHGGSLTMTGSRDGDAFRRQQEIVVERWTPQIPIAVRARQARLARASIAINCALAGLGSGAAPRLGGTVAEILGLGPAGWARLLGQSRLLDRLLPRLRLRLRRQL